MQFNTYFDVFNKVKIYAQISADVFIYQCLRSIEQMTKEKGITKEASMLFQSHTHTHTNAQIHRAIYM